MKSPWERLTETEKEAGRVARRERTRRSRERVEKLYAAMYPS